MSQVVEKICQIKANYSYTFNKKIMKKVLAFIIDTQDAINKIKQMHHNKFDSESIIEKSGYGD